MLQSPWLEFYLHYSQGSDIVIFSKIIDKFWLIHLKYFSFLSWLKKMKYFFAVVILQQQLSYFLFFDSYFGILDVNSMYHSQDNITNKVSTTPSCFQTSNDPYLKEEVRYQNEKENKQNSEIYPLDQEISSNDTTCPKITRSATISDVQLLLLEKQSFTVNTEEENASDRIFSLHFLWARIALSLKPTHTNMHVISKPEIVFKTRTELRLGKRKD